MTENMNLQERIDRITEYERCFDSAAEEMKTAESPETCRKLAAHIAALEAYYDGGAWREDYEADEQGLLPSDLKRGVLSQDALYDLLTEYRSLTALAEAVLK